MDPFKILNSIKHQQLNSVDFKADARRVRQSKKWKENRSELLESHDSCEWCGKETDSFDVHHTWGKSFSRQWMKATDEAFIKSEAYSETLTENRDECPNCGKRDYYKRKTKEPPYRCNYQGCTFDSPRTIDGGEAILNESINNKPYTTYEYHQKKAEWVQENQNIVLETFTDKYDSLLDEYASLREDQVVVICSACHYKEERTRKKRCENCGENWYDPKKSRDKMCWDCIVEENGLEKCPNCDDNWYNPSKTDACKNCR